MPVEYEPSGPCVVEQAKIIEVFPEAYSCSVATLYGQRIIPDVKFVTPTLHGPRGAGMNFMPDIGDICYVFIPADGSGPFVLGFVLLEDPDARLGGDTNEEAGPDFTGERPRLEPGDMSLTTQDGNFVIIRRGGVVQIGATTLAQRVYIPIENVIRDYFQRYHGFSPIGEIIWDHSQVTSDNLNSGDISAIVKFSCREKLSDKSTSVEVRVGHVDKTLLDATINSNLLQEGNTQKIGDEDFVGDGDEEHLIGKNRKVTGLGFEPDNTDTSTPPCLLSFVVNPQHEGVKYTFQVDKEGSNFIRTEAHIHVEAEKGIFFSANEDFGFRSETGEKQYLEIKDYIRAQVNEALLEILANGDINLKGNHIQLDAEGNVTVKALGNMLLEAGGTLTLAAPNVNFGKSAAMDFLVNASAFKDALENHQHGYINLNVPSATTPLTPVIPGALLSGDKDSGTQTKVKIG